MGRRRLDREKRDLLKGRRGEITRSTVSLRHVDVPNAELRLEQALELLLAGTLFPGETVIGEDLRRDRNVGDSAADGDAK
ncbi:MAG: hypothetical protein GH158_05570 [Dehalococcoidia bacterium]|jgi:hypothetical protein|nr:hypothetical protein [Dehalococcoidia bacterium]